jgi:hypothetical protein
MPEDRQEEEASDWTHVTAYSDDPDAARIRKGKKATKPIFRLTLKKDSS